jgi:putative endonuclease
LNAKLNFQQLNTKEEGRLGEKIAEFYLLKKGYQVIEKNFQKKIGEIDLILKKGQKVIFLEVKSRFQRDITQLPKEPIQSAVSSTKRKKIKKTANLYIKLKNFSPEGNYRFDVITVLTDGIQAKINHFKYAF